MNTQQDTVDDELESARQRLSSELDRYARARRALRDALESIRRTLTCCGDNPATGVLLRIRDRRVDPAARRLATG